LAKRIVSIPHKFRLAGAISFRKDYSPPLYSATSILQVVSEPRSLICGPYRPERMASYGLDVECPHIFYGTHFARWKNWMTCNFKFICPQMWWMVDVGFSHVLDERNLTQTQEKCLDLDIQATNILFRSLHDFILCEVMDKETAHEI
jgi:hypothetical protein